MTKKLAFLSLGITAALVAADFWTKPAADWTEREIDQMISGSPWADRMAVETGQRGNISTADDGKGPMQGNLTAPIVVVWRTATPIRQALARRGQPLTDTEPTSSILQLSGFPGMFRADAADNAKLTADTAIKVKGKPDIHPTEIQLSAAAGGGPAPTGAQEAAPEVAPPTGGRGPKSGTLTLPSAPGASGGGRGFGGTFNLLMLFPKNAGLSVDDKEFEFVTKVGKMTIRKKFKLKEMVYNGKLEM
jgi:hypothetical protein